MVYGLHCPVPYAVHPLYPQHLILGFELFRDALTLCHLFVVARVQVSFWRFFYGLRIILALFHMKTPEIVRFRVFFCHFTRILLHSAAS